MIHVKKISHTTLFVGFFTSLIKLASLLKVSFVVGSITAFFSGVNCVSPLAGAFGGVRASGLVSLCSMLIRTVLFGFNPFILAVYHIPGFCASAYLATRHWAVRLALPLVCMALFIAHPAGTGAAAYTLYWLIPAALFFVPVRSFFINALGSTLTAHAVGSVIWLYATAMPAAAWLGLIPVVAVERIMFAAGMTLVYHALVYAQRFAQKNLNSVRTSSPIVNIPLVK